MSVEWEGGFRMIFEFIICIWWYYKALVGYFLESIG
jgi:hypothetical protein